jgi:hypothetical protein
MSGEISVLVATDASDTIEEGPARVPEADTSSVGSGLATAEGVEPDGVSDAKTLEDSAGMVISGPDRLFVVSAGGFPGSENEASLTSDAVDSSSERVTALVGVEGSGISPDGCFNTSLAGAPVGKPWNSVFTEEPGISDVTSEMSALELVSSRVEAS